MKGKGSASNRFTLAIPSATRYLKDVRRFVVRHGRNARFSEEVVDAMRIAVDEACANIIEHAYEGRPDQEVNIVVTISQDSFVVSLRDQGAPFDRAIYREPDVVMLTQQRASGGLGVQMIRMLVDQVEYMSEGSSNEIRLTKFRMRQAGEAR